MTNNIFPMVSAEAVRKELMDKINADESKDLLWIQVMQKFDQHLPFLRRGNPTKEECANSIIGELGCMSLVEFIESEKGLGWKKNTYDQYRKAWKILNDNPWLKECGLSYNGVLKLRPILKEHKPSSIEELESIQQKMQEEKQQQKEATVYEMKARIAELEKFLAERNAQVDVMKQQIQQLNEIVNKRSQKPDHEFAVMAAKLDAARVENATFADSVQQLKVETEQLKSQLENEKETNMRLRSRRRAERILRRNFLEKSGFATRLKFLVKPSDFAVQDDDEYDLL